MELSELLAASGILGVLASLGLASIFFVVQPIWAIIDCIDSERDRDAKLLVSIALFATWGFGSLLYGLFFAVSRNLRRFTVGSLILLFLLGVGGLGSCTLGAIRAAQRARQEAEVARQAAALAVREFQPAPIAVDAVERFRALHFVGSRMRRSAAVADFTLAGPIAASARDVSDRIRHVAAGPDALFAITDHDFGAVSPSTGELLSIAVEPKLEELFSWPKGLAFDAEAQKIVIMTSHVYTRFFRYDPRSSAWELLPSEHRDMPLVAAAWLPEQALLYSLELPPGASELTALQRFNASGAHLGPLTLDPPVPLPLDHDGGFQLQASSGMLLLLVPPPASEAGAGAVRADDVRIYAIDPGSGAVFAPRPRRGPSAESSDAAVLHGIGCGRPSSTVPQIPMSRIAWGSIS